MSEELTIAINGNFCQRLIENYEKELPHIEKQELIRLIDETSEEISINTHLIQLYDFCVIASEADTLTARKVKQDISKQFRITGCLYEDVCVLGGDVFEVYSNMMERSTKLLFLITKNFTSDSFCMRVQNAAVFKCIVNKAATSREKCVPLILESGKDIDLPLAMTGITGIKYNDVAEQMSPVLFNAFANDTRKREILQKRYTEKYFKALVDRRVQEVIAEQQKKALQVTYPTTLQIEGLVAHEGSNGAAGVLQGLQQPVESLQQHLRELVTQMKSDNNKLSSANQVNSSNHNQISGNQMVHAGDKIVINIINDGRHIVESTSSSSSSEEDSENDI